MAHRDVARNRLLFEFDCDVLGRGQLDCPDRDLLDFHRGDESALPYLGFDKRSMFDLTQIRLLRRRLQGFSVRFFLTGMQVS